MSDLSMYAREPLGAEGDLVARTQVPNHGETRGAHPFDEASQRERAR